MNTRLLVIDTQSVLDWLVFRDPLCDPWNAALQGRDWDWIFTSPMKAEFDFVAAKGFGARWPVPAPAELDAAWDAFAHRRDIPEELGAGARLHCSDSDDQKFIDFAISARAHTLVSRDKALLRLARKAADRHALRICTPAAWTAGLVSAPLRDELAPLTPPQ